jgi:hypothetical protein
MPAELRKRYLKQEGGRWTIVGEHQASRRTQIAAVSALERTIVEARAVPFVSES